MVSFWPWSRNSSSTLDFEKTLSALSLKISTAQTRLDSTRTRARRVKVLLVLYLTFAYVVYAILAFLVVGSREMGSLEWTGVSGAPLAIYLARYTVATYYDFRIDTLETRLKELQAEREKTIQKLKDATKYDSTMELLEKYGGGPKSNKSPDKSITPAADPKAKSGGGVAAAPKRTNQLPPPTANINRVTSSGASMIRNTAASTPSAQIEVSEEFAPNAFGDLASTQPIIPNPVQRTASSQIPGESHWYDRILDLLLGEDEKDAKNRIILMCQKCRLINGQAPPGVKSLEEIGIWKCMSCGASNGKLDEGVKILDAVLKAKETAQAGTNISSPGVNSDRTSSSSSQ